MMAARTAPSPWHRLLAGIGVFLAMSAYYYVFFMPPRWVGYNDPDRFYHLGLSRLISTQGLLRTLPQAEDLGWGHYFPDKEFLFHVFTGAADWVGGPVAVLALVPMFGIAISMLLYGELSRVIRPWQAATLTAAGTLLTADYLFRLTLLRPHLLAVFCFCALLVGILRRKPWLAAIAAAGFAMSYHAYYLVVLTAGAAAFAYHSTAVARRQTWTWAMAGLVLGILLNPYFPSNLLMSWTHVQIALGIGAPPGAIPGDELLPISPGVLLQAIGFVPICAGTALVVLFKHRPDGQRDHDLVFLTLLTLGMLALSFKSRRALEYAVPASILLAGYIIRAKDWKGWIPSALVALCLIQGFKTATYYRDMWGEPRAGYSYAHVNVVSAIPEAALGAKVFNCDWSSSPYLLFLRPDLRFVDILDPVFLWKASPERYLMRQRLVEGRSGNPSADLRTQFHADFVLCGDDALSRQMSADKQHFLFIPSKGPSDSYHLYAVRASGQAR
jgi:hypothetical protein